MSIISIPNQPILIPYSETSCKCGDDTYAQLVDYQDELFLQIKLDCTSEGFPEVRSTISQWEETGSLICADGEVGGFYKFDFEPDQVYNTFVITLNVTSYTSGSLFVNIQGGQTYEITSAGSVNLYFNTDVMDTDLTPLVSIFSDDFVGCFSKGSILTGLQVFGLFSGHRFFIVDQNDEVVQSDADYYQVNENFLTVGFDLKQHDALPDGCYKIAYSDECDNVCAQFRITNGQFTYNGGWTLLNGAVINSSTNVMTFTQTGLSAPQATNETLACTNKEYYIEFKINSITGGSLVATVGNSGVSAQFVSGSAPGVFSGTVTSTVGTDFLLRLSGSNGDVVVVDYFIARFADDETPIITAKSNLLQVGDYSSCEYVKIEGCNADDSFGFKFNGSGFIPGIRVNHRFFRAAYEADVERYRKSNGDRGVHYADVTKVKTLRIESQPEYVFDFLSIAVWFDSFFVNTTPYELRSDEFPAVEWNDGYELGAVGMELIQATGLLRKVNCSGNEPSCLPTVFGDGEDYLLLENGDRLVFEGGDNALLQDA
jgi:hypothetical protein